MSPDLPPKVYVTHEFFLPFSENLNISLKPYTQEEWLKFSLLNSWRLKWCLKHTWWVNFSKYVHDWDQDSPLLSTYVKRKILYSILLKTFDTSGSNSPPQPGKVQIPQPPTQMQSNACELPRRQGGEQILKFLLDQYIMSWMSALWGANSV